MKKFLRASTLACAAVLLALPATAGERTSRDGQAQDSMRQDSMPQGSMRQDQDSRREDQDSMREDPMRQDARRMEQSAQRQDQRREGMRQLSGTIVQTKEVQRKQGGANVVAQVETRAGDLVVVDLGDAERWRRRELQQGDRVDVQGYPARLGNRLVLMADRVRLNGETYEVAKRKGQNRADRPMDARQIRGKVQRTTTAQVRGAQEPNTIVLITAEEGSSYIVDLGQARDYNPQDLQGQEISVRGRDVRIEDKVLLLSEQFRVGDETYTVVRPAVVSYLKTSQL